MMHKSGTSSETRSASKCTCTRAAGSTRQPALSEVKAAEWGNVSSATWIVLRVKPQTEFQTRDTLHEAGHDALVPFERKYCRISRYSRKREPRDYPLFPRYVFATDTVRAGTAITSPSLRTVAGIMTTGGRPYRLSAAEIAWIRTLSDEGTEVAGLNLHQALRAGNWVQIVSGPFIEAGTGFIEAIREQRADVVIEMFGAPRSVEMPLEALEVA